MYFLALATDYDETLAYGGAVAEDVRAALRRCKDSGRRLILVTGRQVADLEAVFGDLALFDRVVAENGAVLYTPATRRERLLAPPPPALFVERLREREAHHLLPAQRGEFAGELPAELCSALLITVHPEALSPKALARVEILVGVGPAAAAVVSSFCAAAGIETPLLPGPLAIEIADGVDDATWEFHRSAHDYSRWVRTAIKDESLAREIERVEASADLDAGESRGRIAAAVRARYTVPAEPELR